MRTSSERSSTTPDRDVLITAYENLCAAILAADANVERIDDLTIRRLERTIVAFRSRTGSPRSVYMHLPQAIERATEIVEWLQGMRRDESTVVLTTRATLRGELRRLLSTLQFVHVTPADLTAATATIMTSRRRATGVLLVAASAAEHVSSGVPQRRRAGTRMLDRVAAAVRTPGQVFGESLVLAQV